MSEPTSRASRLLAFAIAAFALLHFAVGIWQLQDRTVDDGFIYFRQAENLANGDGFVWNVGEEPTDGATNFLHFIAIAALNALGIDLRIASLLLASISAVSIFALVALAFRARLGALFPAGMALLAVFLVDERMTANNAVSGLGSVLDGLMAVCVWLAALAQLRAPTLRRAVVLATASFLACIARPSGVLFTAVLYAVLLVDALVEWRRGDVQRLRVWGAASALTALSGAAFAAFKWFTFGYLLTNPFYLKSTAGFDVQWSALGQYLAYVLLPLAPLVLAACLFVTREGLQPLFAEPKARARFFATLLPPLTLLVYYSVATVVAVANFRFFYPTYIFFFVGLLSLLPACTRGSAALRTKALLLAASIGLGLGVARGYSEGSFTLPPERSEMRPLESTLKDIGVALGETGLGREATVMNDSAGAIPYFSKFRHIDRGGLVDNYLSGREPLTGLEREEYLWSRGLDLYIGYEPAASPRATGPDEDVLMKSPYVQMCLQIEARDATTLRTFAQTPELLHLRMRELRDHWRLVGQFAPVSYWEKAWNLKYFAYVRRDSPHADVIAAALEDLIELGPDEVDLGSVSKNAERAYLKRLFEQCGGDFGEMARVMLDDARQAPVLKARYRQLIKR